MTRPRDDLTAVPDVLPFHWVQAVRRWATANHYGHYEQLALEGMPEPIEDTTYRATLLALFVYADKTGKGIRVGPKALGAFLAVSETTARRKLRLAREQGWIVRTRGGNYSSPAAYALVIPPGLALTTGDQSNNEKLSTGEPDDEPALVAPDQSNEVADSPALVNPVSCIDQMGALHWSNGGPALVTRDHQTENSRTEQQQNARARDLFDELLLWIPKRAHPEPTKRVLAALDAGAAGGWTAHKIRDELLNELPANYGPGLVVQLLDRCATSYPKNVDSAPEWLAALSGAKGLPE